MKSITSLHEEFISSARRSFSFDKLPIAPVVGDVPIVVSNKWAKSDGSLIKTFKFLNMEQRNKFVSSIFEYEAEVGHHSKLVIENEEVTLSLKTHDVGHVTELDKEYAKFADSLFKDVIYLVNKVSYTIQY